MTRKKELILIMTDVLKMGKKVLTIGVVATTILWSLGVAAFVAPLIAQADTTVTLNAGDVIKGASTKNVFYYAADGKRYTFPTQDVYFSWYKDWTNVRTISDAQLGGITIGGTVAYRPGTQLVKIQTDPKVYAVEANGTLRWVETEAIAKALWGTTWGTRVRDVDPAIFPYVYSISASTINTATYPVGSLVKLGSDYYLIGAGMTKQLVTAAGLTANNYQTKFAATATDLSAYTTGTDVTVNVPTLTTVTGAAVAGGTVVPSGTGLTVSLAADTPASATVVSDTTNGAQALIPALKLNFTASNDGDVMVKTVSLTRGGISSDTDVVNMYLYDGSTLLASTPSINNKVFTFNNSSGLFTVSKGTTKTLTVKFDVVNNASAGKTITFSVAGTTAVVTNGASVNGVFPVTSNTFTTASVTDLGKFTLASVAPAANNNVDPGQTGYEIWRMTATTQNQDVQLERMNFTVVGSVNVGDLTNFSLWDGGTQIGSTVASMNSDKTVTFDFSAVPYKFTKGQVRNLSLKADIVGGSTRTFRATIQNSSDLVVKDLGYGVYLKHNGSDSFTVIQPNSSGTAVNYTVSSGTVGLAVAVDSPTGNVASSTTNVLLSKFNVKANGEDIKFTDATFACTDVTNSGRTLANLKIYADGSQIGVTKTSLACDGTTWTPTFGSTWIVRVGQTSVLEIKADVTGTTTAGDNIHADMTAFTAQGLTSLSTPTSASLIGRTLTVAAGTLTAVKNPAFGDKSSSNPTGVSNAAGVKIASFVIVGGAGEDADVTSISLQDVDTTNYVSSFAQNLKLMHGTTQLGATINSPASGATTVQTHTFNISPALVVPAGSQYVVDVYADLKYQASPVTMSSGVIKFASVTANGHVTGTSASYSPTAFALQNGYIATAGSLTVAVNSDTPLATNLLMGAVDQNLAKFDLTAAASEPLNLTQLVVSANFTSAATGTLKNIRLYDDTGVQIGTAVSGFDTTNASSTYAHAVFSNLSLQVPAGVTKTITVKADVTTYLDGGYSTTGQAVQLAILPAYTGTSLPVTGTGAQSGTALSASTITFTSNGGSAPWTTVANTNTTQVASNVGNVRANEMVLYRAKLGIAWASDAPSGAASPSASQTVAKFVVTNLANAGAYVASVRYVNFGISTTISNSTASSRTLTVYKDSLSTTALDSTTFTGGADIAHNIGNTDWNIDGANWNVSVASGASRTFYVTMDTTDAASTKSFSITIPNQDTALGGTADAAKGFVWSDGVTTTIMASDNVLPLTYKTFTY